MYGQRVTQTYRQIIHEGGKGDVTFSSEYIVGNKVILRCPVLKVEADDLFARRSLTDFQSQCSRVVDYRVDLLLRKDLCSTMTSERATYR